MRLTGRPLFLFSVVCTFKADLGGGAFSLLLPLSLSLSSRSKGVVGVLVLALIFDKCRVIVLGA